MISIPDGRLISTCIISSTGIRESSIVKFCQLKCSTRSSNQHSSEWINYSLDSPVTSLKSSLCEEILLIGQTAISTDNCSLFHFLAFLYLPLLAITPQAPSQPTFQFFRVSTYVASAGTDLRASHNLTDVKDNGRLWGLLDLQLCSTFFAAVEGSLICSQWWLGFWVFALKASNGPRVDDYNPKNSCEFRAVFVLVRSRLTGKKVSTDQDIVIGLSLQA